jgi:hypothetical protein
LGRTVRELSDTLDARELAEWRAFEQIEGPFGESRADLRMGILASVCAAPYHKRGARPLKPEDFIPQFAPRRPQTLEEMKDVAVRMVAFLAKDA